MWKQIAVASWENRLKLNTVFFKSNCESKEFSYIMGNSSNLWKQPQILIQHFYHTKDFSIWNCKYFEFFRKMGWSTSCFSQQRRENMNSPFFVILTKSFLIRKKIMCLMKKDLQASTKCQNYQTKYIKKLNNTKKKCAFTYFQSIIWWIYFSLGEARISI